MPLPHEPTVHSDEAEMPRFPYQGLRLTIRLTGVLLMAGGLVYFLLVLGSFFRGHLFRDHPGEIAFAVVVTLLSLGLGYFVLRVGWAMLSSVDPGTVSIFSFLFALVYTPVLFYLLPSSALLSEYSALLLILMVLYFGLTYLILNRILLFLLFPRKKNSTRL